MIGCDQQKQETDEPVPAKNFYTSPYFSCKRRYAEAVSNPGEDTLDGTTDWTILSAEYAIRWPHIKIEPYDTTIEDLEERAAPVRDVSAYSVPVGRATV